MTFKTLGIDKNFLGIEPEFSSFASSKIVILPVPYEYTTSYGAGTKHGPHAILDASHYVEFYDEEMRRELHAELGIATVEPLNFETKKGRRRVHEEAFKLIYDVIDELLAEGKFVVTLGGEHTISIAAEPAVPGLVVVDARCRVRCRPDERVVVRRDELARSRQADRQVGRDRVDDEGDAVLREVPCAVIRADRDAVRAFGQSRDVPGSGDPVRHEGAGVQAGLVVVQA